MTSEADKAVLEALFPFGCEANASSKGESKEQKNEETEELKRAKLMEIDGVKAAESGDINKAIELFSQAISVAPSYASAYNNRAQAYRLINEPESALRDLNEAIRTSNGVGKAACQAFTQRAMLHRLNGKIEEAKNDYEAAAAMGSMFAKVQLAALNPYAAMCNKMLAQMISKVQRGENEQSLDWGPPA